MNNKPTADDARENRTAPTPSKDTKEVEELKLENANLKREVEHWRGQVNKAATDRISPPGQPQNHGGSVK